MEAEEDELVQESITENESYVVYFGWNPSQGDEKHTKIGKTGNLKSRESSLNTSFSEYGMNFEYLVKCNSDKEEAEIENYLQAYFYDYSTMHFKNHTGGTEWFNKRFKLHIYSTRFTTPPSLSVCSECACVIGSSIWSSKPNRRLIGRTALPASYGVKMTL